MEVQLLSPQIEGYIELLNMALGIIGGVFAVMYLTSTKGEVARAWRWIAAGILLFAVSELVGGSFALIEMTSEIEPTVNAALIYGSIQTVSILLLLTGVIYAARSDESRELSE